MNSPSASCFAAIGAEINPAPLYVLGGLWLFALGACFGSFMNVVAYRLPARKSLLHPPSRCPACGHDIRWRDNLPVLSWFVLRGRCRDCASPISGRYPFVEASTGFLFVMLAIVELVLHPGVLGLSESFAPFLTSAGLGIYAYHLLLLCALICGALVDSDGHLWPWRLTVPVAVVGFVLPLFWLFLRPVILPAGFDWLLDRPVALSLLDGVHGVILGVLLGPLSYVATGLGPAGRKGLTNALLSRAWLGAFLGPQPVVFIWALTSILFFVQMVITRLIPNRRGLTWMTCVVIATLYWLASPPRPDRFVNEHYWPQVGLGALVIALCSVGAWWIARRWPPRAENNVV